MASTPLHIAAEDGNVKEVENLLTSGVDVNAKDKLGWTPLHDAARKGHVEVASILANYPKIQINIKNNDGNTPLMIAAYYGQVEVLNELIKDKYGVDINAQGDDGASALHRAAQNGHVEVASILANHPKIQINIKTKKGETPLDLAVKFKHGEVVKVFTSGLHDPARNGNVKVIEILLNDGVDVNEKDVEGNARLHLAAEKGHVEVVRILASHQNININIQNKLNDTPLNVAASNGHVEVVRELLQDIYNTDVNVQDDDGASALHRAAEMGHVEVVSILASHPKIIINIQDDERRTPLYWAALNGKVNIVKKLLNYGADVNLQDVDRKAPLHRAAENGHVEVVSVLASHPKININIQSKHGDTALHLAFCNKSMKVVEELLKQCRFMLRDPNHNADNIAEMVEAIKDLRTHHVVGQK